MFNTKRLTISALVVALYLVILYITQSISFGAIQIRIGTALYALAYVFPFLVLPMGVANLIANFLFGGLGPIDMVGGFIVGIMTTFCIAKMRFWGWSPWWVIIPIIVVPGLCVPLWLSYLLDIPYAVLVINVGAGQLLPAIVGALLARALQHRLPF